MTDEYVVACYDMSLKEFEHSAVCDLFKVCYLTFSLSCLLHFSCLEFLFFFFFFKKKKKKKKKIFRQFQSSLQRPGRPQRWTRRGYKRLKMNVKVGLRW